MAMRGNEREETSPSEEDEEVDHESREIMVVESKMPYEQYKSSSSP